MLRQMIWPIRCLTHGFGETYWHSWKQLKFPMINLLMRLRSPFQKGNMRPCPAKHQGRYRNLQNQNGDDGQLPLQWGPELQQYFSFCPLDFYIPTFDNAFQFWHGLLRPETCSSINAAKRDAVLSEWLHVFFICWLRFFGFGVLFILRFSAYALLGFRA